MGYIGGNLQERFVDRVRGADRERLLAVPIDVGKHTAAALVCDFWGQVVVPPFTFALNERGLELFRLAVARAEATREAAWIGSARSAPPGRWRSAGPRPTRSSRRPERRSCFRSRSGGSTAGSSPPTSSCSGVLDREVEAVEAALAEILPRTPAAILTTMPRVAVVRASNYGGAVGDPTRFQRAAQVYRLSGLVPKLYESAGRRRAGTRISREGKVELREAILELGKALRQGHPDFGRYARELQARGKRPGVVACALGHRANRVAFAMLRDQVPFDPERWR
jgi:hypothetical protein